MGTQDILSEIMPMIMGGGAAGSAHHPSAAPFVMSTANPWMMMHENGTNWMPGVGSMVMGMGSNALPNKSKNKKQGGDKDKTIRAAKRSRKSKDGEEVDDDGDDKSSPTNDDDNNDINDDSQEEEEEEDNEPSINLVSDSWQKDVLDKIPRCKSAEGIRETSYFVTSPEGQHAISNAPIGGRVRKRNNFAPASSAAVGSLSNISCLRKLLAELNRMEYEDGEQLPGGEAPIWLRYDDECPQYMRAIITGPSSTPYAHGLFAFDIYVPDSYPNVAPKVQLLTTGGGVMRFSPNLYANGKVCLSLLGTWSGPKWDPGHSSILQILVSIQGLILGVKHPYFLEPGYGGWEENGNNLQNMKVSPKIKSYENKIRLGTIQFAATTYIGDLNKWTSSGTMPPSLKYLSAFTDILRAHFWHRKDYILANMKKLVANVASENNIQKALEKMEKMFAELKEPQLSISAASFPTLDNADIEMKDGDNGKPRALNGKTDESLLSPETIAKRRDMEAAAAKGDYITAGRIQAQLESGSKIQDMIVSRRKEMEEAAEKQDYVEAGRLQAIVMHLESNQFRLQDLESRMHEHASNQDYVKASHFQQQYRILIEGAEEEKHSTTIRADARGKKKLKSFQKTYFPPGVSPMDVVMPPVGPLHYQTIDLQHDDSDLFPGDY